RILADSFNSIRFNDERSKPTGEAKIESDTCHNDMYANHVGVVKPNNDDAIQIPSLSGNLILPVVNPPSDTPQPDDTPQEPPAVPAPPPDAVVDDDLGFIPFPPPKKEMTI
ncbi:MAG: hypothetical protein WCP87_01460, partial [Atribacterota bacterium]